MQEFGVNFLANLLSTLVASVLIYFAVENRISNRSINSNIINNLKNAYSELIGNSIIAERIREHEDLIRNTNKIPMAHFEFHYLKSFLNESVDILMDKEYSFLHSQIVNLKTINALIDLLNSNQSRTSIIENKKELISSSKSIQTHIQKALQLFVKFNEKYKFLK